MTAVAVDTSALIAILYREVESGEFVDGLAVAGMGFISAATLHEAHCVTVRSGINGVALRLAKLIEQLQLTILPFDEEMPKAARDAYSRFGRGTGHRAKLNMGDCFAYALAKSRGLPLLFKGDDFIHTDVAPALAG